MNAVIQSKNHYTAEFERVAADLAGHSAPWLRELRRAALERFTARGFPAVRDEDWKYTRTDLIARRAFGCAVSSETAQDADKIDRLLQAESAAQRMVFVNGRYFPALSRLDKLPAGVTVNGLGKALREDAAALQDLFGAVATLERHPFAALNTAFVDDGVYLALGDGAALEQPLHVVFVTTAAQEGRAAQPRLLVRAGDYSRAVLIERHVALGDAECFNNVLAEIALGRNASLDYYRVQEQSAKSLHVGGVHVRQERDSRFNAYTFSLGCALLRDDIDVQLAAEGAQCALHGLYLADGRQHVDIHTRIDHLRAHGASSEFYKGILDGRGRGVFNGKVVVHPDAQKTDARQVNRNLLLSDDAEADSKPQLEIYADDVKCSHGAAVGQLDADAVFYLRSRGLDEDAARGLLVYAFAAEIIDLVEVEALRGHLDRAVRARLPQGVRLEGSP